MKIKSYVFDVNTDPMGNIIVYDNDAEEDIAAVDGPKYSASFRYDNATLVISGSEDENLVYVGLFTGGGSTSLIIPVHGKFSIRVVEDTDVELRDPWETMIDQIALKEDQIPFAFITRIIPDDQFDEGVLSVGPNTSVIRSNQNRAIYIWEDNHFSEVLLPQRAFGEEPDEFFEHYLTEVIKEAELIATPFWDMKDVGKPDTYMTGNPYRFEVNWDGGDGLTVTCHDKPVPVTVRAADIYSIGPFADAETYHTFKLTFVVDRLTKTAFVSLSDGDNDAHISSFSRIPIPGEIVVFDAGSGYYLKDQWVGAIEHLLLGEDESQLLGKIQVVFDKVVMGSDVIPKVSLNFHTGIYTVRLPLDIIDLLGYPSMEPIVQCIYDRIMADEKIRKESKEK